VATLNAQRISKEMELGYIRSFASSDEAGARQLEAQLSIVDEELSDLEMPAERAGGRGSRARAGAPAPGMLPAALAVPKLRAEYERLLRDRKVAEATLIFTLDRLEGARAAEARNVSTFVVLDPPTIPTRKSRPSGLAYSLGGAFLGFAVSVALSGWRAWRAPPPGP
jgi:capsule polysaccharide export protein KpsE/RkpR